MRTRRLRRSVPEAEADGAGRADGAGQGRTAVVAYDCLFPCTKGGGERVYRRIAEDLVDRGFRVRYVTRQQWPDDAPPAAPFAVVSVWRGEIADARGTRRLGAALGFARGLYRELRRSRGAALAVVSALPVLNVFAAAAALRGSGTALVVDWLEVWPWRKWRAYSGLVVGTVAWMLQTLARPLGHVCTANSAFTARRLGRRGVVVLGLMDIADIPESVVGAVPDASTGTATEAPYALCVGRHIPDKRVAVLPAALAQARRVWPDLRLVVVGSGPDTERLREEIAACGLTAVVDLPGRVSEDELHRLFAGAALLVNASAREGFGLVVAEAAAFGTPSVVVAGEDNAAAALVVPGTNGAIAASADPEPLAAAMCAVLEGGAALRESTRAWFGVERRTRTIPASMDTVLGLVAGLRSGR